MARMLCVLQALFHTAVLADLQGVATDDVIKGAAATGAVTNSAAVVGTAAIESAPIDAMESCPEGLVRRCFSDGCNCGRPPRPVIRPRPIPRPKPTLESLAAKDAAVIGAATNGSATTGALTNGAAIAGPVPTVIPATKSVPVDAMETCPEGLIRRCFSDGCNCGRPPRPVIRPRPIPRPRPSPKPTSAMATGINGATANGAAAIGDAAAGALSTGAAVSGATNNGVTSTGAVANGVAVKGAAIGEDATGKCLKGLRRRCLDDGCYCVKHPPGGIPRKNKSQANSF